MLAGEIITSSAREWSSLDMGNWLLPLSVSMTPSFMRDIVSGFFF